LKEVRLELKSVKEIVNMLSRDLAAINMRIHNLHEQESPHIAAQPFGNWPSRHSIKKSYSEVTAYKPYIVTKHCFQSLENLQENDSSMDVLSEISQPGKDNCSVIKVRSDRVKVKHKVTKDINKTHYHYHNANFGNPAMKDNLTIPVIVKGQALSRKSNPVKRQSIKFSPSKDHMVLIIGDSHSRLCASNIKSEIKDNYDVQGLVKPGAGSGTLVYTVNSDTRNLTKNDVVIFCGGANNIAKNNSKTALRHIRNFIKSNNHTNYTIIVPTKCTSFYY
jgi:hypothetical protein